MYVVNRFAQMCEYGFEAGLSALKAADVPDEEERATHNTAAAWQSAEPLVTATSLSDDRLIMLASLALEADRPEHVSPLLARLAVTRRHVVLRTELTGRSLI